MAEYLDDTEKLTVSEIQELKKLAAYSKAAKIVWAFIISLVGIVSVFNIHNFLDKP